METCRAHVHKSFAKEANKFEQFEKGCLEQDSIALVEYALDLKKRGCKIDLNGKHRRLQKRVRRTKCKNVSPMASLTCDQLISFRVGKCTDAAKKFGQAKLKGYVRDFCTETCKMCTTRTSQKGNRGAFLTTMLSSTSRTCNWDEIAAYCTYMHAYIMKQLHKQL